MALSTNNVISYQWAHMKQYNLGVVGRTGTTCMIRLGETVNSGFLKDIL